MRNSPKLPLTAEERTRLRAAKVKLREVAYMDVGQLAERMQCSRDRARWIRALAEFQTIPSIGPKLAQMVVGMGFHSMEEIRGEDGAALTDRLEKQNGYWVDPCVEDSLRCIVHHANHPESERSWFDFTAERKAFRAKHGYPVTRPTVAWHEQGV